MNIGLDIDGVVYSYQEALYSEMVALYGVTCSYSDFWTKEFQSYSKLKQDNLIRCRHIYTKSLPPVEWSNCLQRIAKKHNLFYVTARPYELRYVTQHTFESWNYPNLDRIHFTDDKLGACLLEDCDVYVEDRSKYIEQLKDNMRVIVVRKPWNRQYDEGFTVISSILELEGVL